MFHYLHDFLVKMSPGSTECSEYLTILLSVFEHLRVPVAREKLGPYIQDHIPGIEIDAQEMWFACG